MAATKSDAFDDDLFETRLESLKDTQEGIQQMSSWCLQQRGHHKKIVASWLNVFKKVRVEHRLVLFYLANDVIQYSKRKRYEFVESWATALQRATTMVRDEKVKGKILRIFKIWEQREIYSEEYISDLSGLLNINPPKKTQTTHAAAADTASDDYQSATLIANIRDCVSLSTATDNSFKKLPKSPSCDIESIKQQLKDKSHSEDVENEIERYITYSEAYNKNLYSEIKSRKSVIAYLDKAIKFYTVQRGEVKVVSGAYKHFGSRVKLVKKKLDEMIPNLSSPIPSPDINAPSPERDADLQLPDEQSPISVSLFKNNINGYSSYLDGNLPFDINDFKRDDSLTSKSSSQQPIEVIASRSDDGVVDYYKPESISSYSSGGGSNISIPGLNPIPVPPVRSEYTSLARAAQQYGSILTPPVPPIFGGHQHSNNNLHHNYMTGYSGDANYTPNSGPNVPPLMPPPPMPSLNASGGGPGGIARPHSNSSADFNSTWDMSMSWTSMDNSNVGDTPVSPPHFEQEANTAAIEYSEHNNSMLAAQDVDHRQLHLPPAFTIGKKLGLSNDKTRQLDIDHRNLISLTGSPGSHENDKKSWLSSQENNFHTNNSGDVDYRTLQQIDTIPSSKSDNLESSDIAHNSPSSLMAPPGTSGLNKKSNSPQKSNASSSSESQKEDAASGNRYDPTDMVVDMDMSDEDLDDIFREVLDENQAELELVLSTTADEVQSQEVDGDVNGERVDNGARPALLETPHEYLQQNMWESQMSMSGGGVVEGGYGSPAAGMMDMQQQQQLAEQQQHAWNHQMQMSWNGGGGPRGDCVPPPPRPPFPPFYQDAEYRGGGGRGWSHSPHQYRNYSRSPRGGRGGVPGGMHHEGGSPYFNRGRGGGAPMRGPFRGKFRGNHSWI